MDDKEGWRERVRNIRADSATWWWWWWVMLRQRSMFKNTKIQKPRENFPYVFVFLYFHCRQIFQIFILYTFLFFLTSIPPLSLFSFPFFLFLFSNSLSLSRSSFFLFDRSLSPSSDFLVPLSSSISLFSFFSCTLSSPFLSFSPLCFHDLNETRYKTPNVLMIKQLTLQ